MNAGFMPNFAPALREERKIVTVLFADLVGSTSLAERLDPEDVRLVVGEGVARVVAEVERFGGHVKDLAGDGVLAFFGAPVASEDDPERAVRAGLRLTEEIGVYADEVARGFGVQGFAVRVGIGTGPVVLGSVGGGGRLEYGAFGDTVNIAARLQGAAPPGSVLVDAATRRLAGPVFAWGDELALELKGKAAPVVAYEVAAIAPGSTKSRGLEGVATAMLGRERELAAGLDALAGLRAGAGGIIFVTGEAGIGKSRLLHELQEAFEGEWLEGRCVSYGESLPYWPFRELLRGWLGLGADDPELRARITLRRRLEQLFGERAGELAPYFGALLGLTLEPEASVRLGELSPEALQYRTFEVVETLLERVAAERPIVLALEDLHWADSTSVQLLERLLALGERAALLLILAQREERDHPSRRLKEGATREYPHLTLDLRLEPLTGTAERELLHGLVGVDTLPEELEDRILDAAEGNPFFLEELVRSLVDAGALLREESGWRFDHDVPFEVPETVEKVILARIDRLPEACHDVLVAASTLGRTFGLPLLEGVLSPDARLGDTLHELQRLDLLRTSRRWPEPELRFKHVLIQETAYRTLLAEPRRRLHRRAAEWLERRHTGNPDEVLGLLAHHWLGAENEEKAAAYLVRAGDRARAEWALDEAVAHYRTLLPLLERRGESQEVALVLFKLGLALHTALRFAEADAAYGHAFELWQPPAPRPDPTATLRLAATRLPTQPDPPRSYNLPDIQLQMALFDRLVERWPDATIVPSLAERWEVSGDGLRYVFRLREGLTWSDGTPLTAGDVEHGIKRSLDPARPGVSVAMFYVLENGQEYALGRNDDTDAIGVRALDDRTVEFRLVAPAPYFLSIVNRPDGGPQPRHAIAREGERWTDPDRQVVSGAFRQ
ncbi:MAG: AAA family ATPase, partial [Actinobacteria bacterium]|nr:AAA family ATPase [Actinomycetota bacterium]